MYTIVLQLLKYLYVIQLKLNMFKPIPEYSTPPPPPQGTCRFLLLHFLNKRRHGKRLRHDNMEKDEKGVTTLRSRGPVNKILQIF